MQLGEEAVAANIPHAHLYYSQALLDAGFGTKQVEKQLESYFKLLTGGSSNKVDSSVPVDPFLLYIVYQLHKPDASTSKLSKLRAAAALASFRCFPTLAAKWLTPDDNLDTKVIEEGLEKETENEEIDDDFDDDVTPPMSEDDPEYQWKIAKEKHKMVRLHLTPMFSLQYSMYVTMNE
jgi:hypothetical protein